MQQTKAFVPRLALSILLALLSIAGTSCGGQSRQGQSAREVEAIKHWKPTRWETAKASALVVMDMQDGYMPIVRQAEVVANIKRLVAAADRAGSPVVWVYTDNDVTRKGSPSFELIPALLPAESHLKVVKEGQNAFSGTELTQLLEARGVGRLVFCGLASDGCVRASVSAAFYDGYLTVVAKDAHSVITWGGPADAVEKMNAVWGADKRVQLIPSSAIVFDSPQP